MAWKRGNPADRGYGWQWQKLRKAILARDCYLCQECNRNGRIATGNEVDHIVPKAEGGTDEQTNLEVLCAPCHAAKTAHESARAQGRTLKPRLTFGTDGWPTTRNTVALRRKEGRG